MAFVEFGEQGSYQDISQLQAVEDLIKRTSRPLVVTYIHGWHNNAKSADVDRFSHLLAELSTSASVRRSNYQVVGVYIGWRGELTRFPVVTELSFWSRKAAAERLASNFDLYTAVASIAHTAREFHKDKQYTILFGHSFGGLIVERAVSHATYAEMYGLGGSEGSLPADLIVLLNPASDSIISRQMVAALYSRHLENTHEFVVSLTSSGDTATGSWFPIGTSIAATSKSFDEVGVPGPSKTQENERLFYTSTPGHNKFIINHETSDLHTPVPNPSHLSGFEFNLSQKLHPLTFVIPDGPNGSETLKLWRFQPVGAVDVPYWDVRVDPQIIKDHGDIWNDKALAMYAAIFRSNFPLPLQAAPRIAPVAPKPNLQRRPDYNRLY